MYLRFVSERRIDLDGRREGIFHAAAALRDYPETSRNLADSIKELQKWFGDHLVTPERFSRSTSKGHYRRETAGLSWFKPSAHEHIRKAQQLALVLADGGYPVTLLKTDRPGYIIYEDDHQIIAEPFADTPR